jgi:hypothetical protein
MDYLFKHPTSPQPDNHFEVLKEIKNLGNDDDRLLVPALFYLGSERGQRMRRENDASLTPGNIWRMIGLNISHRKLRGHSYNVYECCFLAIGVREGADHGQEADELLFMAVCMTVFSLIAQSLLAIILLYYNWSDITNKASWSKEGGTILVMLVTTAFFPKLVYEHWTNASNFNDVFENKKVSSRFMSPMLFINLFVNVLLGMFIVTFNIFFLLISEHVNEAILNSLAVFFILEIDDTVSTEVYYKDFDARIAENLLDYIKGDGGGVDVHVDMVLPSAASEEDCYLHLLESDDKVYLEVTDDNDQLLVTVYWRRSQFRYVTVQFRITGANGRDFFRSIKEFDCL